MSRIKFLTRAAKMPACRHKLADQEFDLDKSEVVTWLLAQPETKEFIYKTAQQFGAISFDSATGAWAGSGQKPVDSFTPEEVLEALGGKELKFSDVMAACMLNTGIDCGMWKFTMCLKMMVLKGELAFDEETKLYRAPWVKPAAVVRRGRGRPRKV